MSKEEHIHRLIYKGIYKNIPFWIVENGCCAKELNIDYRWYCAYVRVTPKTMEEINSDNVDVHGTITYKGVLPLLGNVYVWGWDYNHYQDMCQFELKTKLQKMPIENTINYIIKDCQKFIRRYVK